MTDANDSSFAEGPPRPVASTAIQDLNSAKEDEKRITLPPLPASPTAATAREQLRKELNRLDLGLAGIVLVLAFLLASFAVRNTDFWLHLAHGRLYSHGTFSLNADPYSYTTGDMRWANHSWLYDLALYAVATIAGGADTSVGGAVLVVVKALSITLLAWVMLAIRRPGQSLWAPAACTGLALVALSPRLSLQPWVISYLFLALTLYILRRPQLRPAATPRTSPPTGWPLASYWFLPLLFLFWVNLDRWFVLGPLTVALFLIGQALQRAINPVRTGTDAPEPGELRTLALVLVIGLAACLINPYTYRALVLPAQLSWQTSVALFKQDPTFRMFFVSPFEPEYWQYRHLGWSIAGLSYYPLVLLGLLSFGLSLGGWRWWRFMVWLGFAILSAYEMHLVPFFAIVAGPITALNFQDLGVRLAGAAWPRVEPLWKLWSLGGRIATLVVGVLVVLAAWPGWLHGRPDDINTGHRVAWRVEVTSGLRQAAEQLKAWHASGILKPEDHGFNFGPDMANYCAWFCADDHTYLPLEPSFFDYRLEAFPEKVAREYIETRQALDPQSRGDSLATPFNWRELFRKNGITHLNLYEQDRADPDRLHFAGIWLALLSSRDQWKLVSLDGGRACIFVWQDPRKGEDSGPPLPRFDPAPLAFGSSAVQAPAVGPERGPQPRELWDRFLRGPADHAAQAPLVYRYLEHYALVRQLWPITALPASEVAAWSGTVAQTPATPGIATVLAPATKLLTSVVVRATLQRAMNGDPRAFDYFLLGKDLGPTGALLLAVRAARQAIADSPDGSTAPYAGLAEAYQQIWDGAEQHWVRAVSGPNLGGQRYPRELMRQVQVITALESALKIQPHDEAVHRMLYGVYLRSQFLDLALQHQQEIVKIVKATGPVPMEPHDDFNRRVEQEEKRLKELDALETRRETDFELKGANMPLLSRARLAQLSGLAGKALQLLLEASPEDMNPATAEMQLNLLLLTGRHLDPEIKFLERLEVLKDVPGMSAERYGMLYEASLGNYEKAGAYLEDSIAQMEQNYLRQMLLSLETQTFILPGAGAMQRLNAILDDVRTTADYRVMRGILALEQGDTATAARFFERALYMNDGKRLDFESRPIAAHYLELIHRAGISSTSR
jgi:tetratricopeptide (TPR) repeat protein